LLEWFRRVNRRTRPQSSKSRTWLQMARRNQWRVPMTVQRDGNLRRRLRRIRIERNWRLREMATWEWEGWQLKIETDGGLRLRTIVTRYWEAWQLEIERDGNLRLRGMATWDWEGWLIGSQVEKLATGEWDEENVNSERDSRNV
jgi:hypothetical protein